MTRWHVLRVALLGLACAPFAITGSAAPMTRTLQAQIAYGLVPPGVKKQRAVEDARRHHAQHGLVLQEGNPGHQQPPPGWHCSPQGWVKDGKPSGERPCTCKRKCQHSPNHDDEGRPDGTSSVTIVEDIQCWAYCFKEQCSCMIHDCEDCDEKGKGKQPPR